MFFLGFMLTIFMHVDANIRKCVRICVYAPVLSHCVFMFPSACSSCIDYDCGLWLCLAAPCTLISLKAMTLGTSAFGLEVFAQRERPKFQWNRLQFGDLLAGNSWNLPACRRVWLEGVVPVSVLGLCWFLWSLATRFCFVWMCPPSPLFLFWLESYVGTAWVLSTFICALQGSRERYRVTLWTPRRLAIRRE